MLNKEDWMQIQAQIEKGVYQKDVAQQLGVSPRTVRRALTRGGAPPGKRPRARRSKLDAFKPMIDQLPREGVWNAKVILREIQSQGYSGEVTVLRDFIRPKRPLRESRATVRFETAPGKQLQNDWGEIVTQVGGCEQKVHFSVNTLGFSRRFHFWCSDREDAEHTDEGLVRSFEHFGGVPCEVLVDNQKSPVIRHRIGERVQFNPRFLDLAGHYGFVPRACRPHRARTKGKDERMVGYIKHNFFLRYRVFESLAHLNQLAEQWLREEADPRVHEIVLYSRKSRNSNLTSRKIPRPVSLPDNFTGFQWIEYPRFLERKTRGKWAFHNLRHRYAACQHSRGMLLYILMERLGHSNLSTTQIYLRSLPSFCPDKKSRG